MTPENVLQFHLASLGSGPLSQRASEVGDEPADTSGRQPGLYGRSRLHVDDPYGARIGWVDLSTGVVVLERRDLESAFHAAIGEWMTLHDRVERRAVARHLLSAAA